VIIPRDIESWIKIGKIRSKREHKSYPQLRAVEACEAKWMNQPNHVWTFATMAAPTKKVSLNGFFLKENESMLPDWRWISWLVDVVASSMFWRPEP